MRHRRFFDIIEPMSRPTTELQMEPPLKHFRDWVQKLLSCKAGTTCWTACWTLSAAVPLALSYLLDPDSSNEEVSHSPPHTWAHSSMRHRRFFDVFEFMYRPTIELQMKPSTVHFRGWVQKLLSCKCWEAWMTAGPFAGNRAARPILSIGPWPTQKYFFEKISSGTLVFLNKLICCLNMLLRIY